MWATGDLKNADDIYKPEIIKRINKAEQQDKVTDIITPENLKNGDITRPKPFNTWHFVADNVTDFACAVSNNYIWKASSIIVDPHTKRRTRVDAVFNSLHTNYIPVVDYSRKTVQLMSYRLPGLPFPYAHITIIDGLDGISYDG